VVEDDIEGQKQETYIRMPSHHHQNSSLSRISQVSSNNSNTSSLFVLHSSEGIQQPREGSGEFERISHPTRWVPPNTSSHPEGRIARHSSKVPVPLQARSPLPEPERELEPDTPHRPVHPQDSGHQRPQNQHFYQPWLDGVRDLVGVKGEKTKKNTQQTQVEKKSRDSNSYDEL